MSVQLAKSDVYSAQLAQRLGEVRYFRDLPPATLEQVVHVIERDCYNPGEQLISSQDTHNDFFIIDQGRIKKEIDTPYGSTIRLQVFHEGQFTGQYSLLQKAPHLVSVIAQTQLEVLKIRQQDFENLLSEYPDFANIFDNRVIRDSAFIDRLQYLAFFNSLTRGELTTVVEQTEMKQFAAGTDLLAEKDSIELLVICEGQINVSRNKNPSLKNIQLTKGHFIYPLSASQNTKIEVVNDVTCFTLSKEAVADILERIPRLKPMLERETLINHLDQMNLFKPMAKEDRQFFAWMANQTTFGRGEYIYKQGDPGARYFIIHQGDFEVRSLRPDGLKPPSGAQLIQVRPPSVVDKKEDSEYQQRYVYGERAVFLGRPYDHSLWTRDTTQLYFFEGTSFYYALRNNEDLEQSFDPHPIIKQGFQYSSFKFAGKTDDEEVIYYCHRHWISFIYGLFKPPTPGLTQIRKTPDIIQNWNLSIETIALVAVVIAAVIWWYSAPLVGLAGTFLQALLSGLATYASCLLLVVLAWVLWNLADWENDYLVITTKRVIRREKLILLYEDQAEAPIEKIQNVTLSTGFLGNMLGYCDLTIDTAAADSTIFFSRSPYPSKLYAFIAWLPPFRWFLPQGPAIYPHQILRTELHEQQGRGKALSAQGANIALRDAIRQEMSLSKIDVWEAAGTASPPPPPPSWGKKMRGRIATAWINFRDAIIPWRYWDIKPDNKNIFVWRKHWTVLVRETWDSTLSFILFTALVIIYFFGYYSNLGLPSLTGFFLPIYFIAAIGYFGIACWFWYEWADWGNDLYILTNSQIIDIEKEPLLLSEKRNQIEVKNIENVVFKQEGILDNLFNIGDVVITTAGGEPLTFLRINNPRDVQHKIFERSQAAKSAAAKAAAEAERKKFTKWFDVYHQNFVNLEGC